MPKLTKILLFFSLVYAFPSTSILFADEVYIAAASNFSETLKQLAKQFQDRTDHRVILTFASTGKLYAQVIHGAPFDAFFSADSKRPELLDEEGIAIANSRFTYAVGKLVLWSPQADLVDKDGKVPGSKSFNYLAIGNPKLAPYGRAAKQVLQAQKQWTALQDRIVRGENVGQAFQYVKSGSAELGFIAYSQIKRPSHPVTGSLWIPPESLYTPINQQAVLLKDKPAARQFMRFIKTDSAQQLIQSFGYGIPYAESK